MRTTPSTRTEVSLAVRHRTVAPPREGGAISRDPAMAGNSSRIIRVLVADQNARLLESISLTFAQRFSIHTTDTLERSADFLRQGKFDLVIVSEQLADGPGLPLLGQIARHSPDTLRIFAARRSKLEHLAGRLGPFGLFRTLPYPIDARRLLSTLTLARTALLLRGDTPTVGNARIVAAARPQASGGRAPRQLQLHEASRPRSVPGLPPPTHESRKGVSHVSSRGNRSASAPQLTRNAQSAIGRPNRVTVFLGATVVAAFLLTILSFRQPDATEPASDTQDTRVTLATTVGDTSASHRQMDRPDTFAPPQYSTPAEPKPLVETAHSLAQLAVSKRNSPGADAGESESQGSAISGPIADPSTFGSEAAEPIYAN
jgi:hypothetical protein